MTHAHGQEWADVIYCTTRIELSFMDRVRVLFGMQMTLRTVTYTENLPGGLLTDSHISVQEFRNKFSRSKYRGASEAVPE